MLGLRRRRARTPPSRARRSRASCDKLYRAGAIDQATYDADRAIHADVKRTIRRLTARAGRSWRACSRPSRGSRRAARCAPRACTRCSSRSQRNREWWSAEPLLASGQRVTFAGSELVWQYVPGQGLQLHPLANFGKLNAYAKGSRRNDARNAAAARRAAGDRRPARRRRWRGSTTSRFDGGRPPWVASLAQGTGAAGDRALGAEARPDAGAAAAHPGGADAVRAAAADRRAGRDRRRARTTSQYSFWPEPAHRQRLRPVARRPLRRRADHRRRRAPRSCSPTATAPRAPRCRGTTPARGRSTRATRSRASPTSTTTCCCATSSPRCATARPSRSTARPSRTSPRYLTIAARARAADRRARGGTAAELRFSLSKISRATVRVTAPTARTVLSAAAGVVGRGTRSVAWKVPRRAGGYTLRVDATDLAGNAASVEGTVEVLEPKRRKRAAK